MTLIISFASASRFPPAEHRVDVPGEAAVAAGHELVFGRATFGCVRGSIDGPGRLADVERAAERSQVIGSRPRT
jgi:hypothetical protein